jgi:large subunit ribosomal protein L1
LVTVTEFAKMAKEAREKAVERGFDQSFELIVTLRDIDIKKTDLNINEVVYLPHPFSKQPSICVFAGGDIALRAKKSGVDRVVEPDELDKASSQKRQMKNIAKGYSFFLAETSLMPKIGKALGQYLGPRGKMPMPVPPNAPIEGMVKRFRSAVRIRSRRQLAVAGKVGDVKLSDKDVAENAMAVMGAVEKNLPSATNNINSVLLKMTMAKPVSLAAVSRP